MSEIEEFNTRPPDLGNPHPLPDFVNPFVVESDPGVEGSAPAMGSTATTCVKWKDGSTTSLQ